VGEYDAPEGDESSETRMQRTYGLDGGAAPLLDLVLVVAGILLVVVSVGLVLAGVRRARH
jgi:hypothetical protein